MINDASSTTSSTANTTHDDDLVNTSEETALLASSSSTTGVGAGTAEERERQFQAICEEFTRLELSSTSLLNTGKTHDRRKLYASSELLAMRLNAFLTVLQSTGSHATEEEIKRYQQEIEKLLEQLTALADKAKLLHSKRKGYGGGLFKILGKVEEFFRLIVTWSFLIVSSTLLALPCLFLVPLDYFLIKTKIIRPSQQISVNCKRFIAYGVIKLSGIHLVEENDGGYSNFGKECSLICFSHASTMDAFIFSAVIPVRHYTLSKSELYLIPFFSWCLIAFGGIPIDRNNRDKAVKSVSLALSSAKYGDCVCISPEGTRSKSGQILAFKKGPFYMWETLKTPIVPLIIYGAYEIYPPGHNMSLKGKVYARFLEPIPPNAAATRDEMSNLVRTKMLEAWRDGPEDAGNELTFTQRIEYYFWLVLYLVTLWLLYHFLPVQRVQDYLQVDRLRLIGLFFGFSIGITLVFYVYLMYLSLPFASLRQRLFGSDKSTGSKTR